jgi:hypothetical protein
MKIKNAANTPLNANSGTVPNVGGAMLDWFQPITFGLVTKTVDGFQVKETEVEVDFMGVWQPLKEREIQFKPEGQRAWSWYWLHADPTLNLKVDDTVNYLGRQYRVMTKKNFSLYGYVEYHLVTDWTGAGPTVETP